MILTLRFRPILIAGIILAPILSLASPEYYTIAEAKNFVTPAQMPSMLSLLNDEFQSDKANEVNLLSWVEHRDPLEQADAPYNRAQHFGSWQNDNSDGLCYNTRAQVLIRDSQTPVTFKQPRNCSVESGTWADPYSGEVFTDASKVQIDHFVPLKNAYISGGWKWNRQQRCIYANFMANNFHLVAVSGHENMVKRDKSPADYLPPNSDFVCSYLDNWLKVKAIWKLVMVPREAEAIHSALRSFGCEQRSMVLSETELRKQRRQLSEITSICSRYKE
jgi:hypothetical protein